MTDQMASHSTYGERGREIRDEGAWYWETLIRKAAPHIQEAQNGESIRRLLSLLDRERWMSKNEWAAAKRTVQELREQVADLLEALERLASIFPGTGEDVMRARALLAKHKEQA